MSTKNLELSTLLPSNFKNPTAVSLIKNLFNRFLTKDNSQPILGWVGDNLANSLFIDQPSFERKLNPLEPILYTQQGAEEFVTSFSDIVDKMKLLGVDVDNMSTWGKAQQFNFAPPINFDKFANFARYRWIGKTIQHKQSLDYNPAMDPEYYMIGNPVNSAQRKVPVKAATITGVSLSGNATIDGVACGAGDRVLVKGQPGFVDNGIYIVSAYSSDNPPRVILTGNVDISVNGARKASNTVAVVNSTTGLVTGIALPVDAGLGYAEPPVVSFIGGGATGATAVAQLDSNGSITGFLITNGGAKWTRSPDFDDKDLSYDANGVLIKEIVTGSLVPVIQGTQYANTFWQLTSVDPIAGTDPMNFKEFVQIVTDWTATNYWVHEADVAGLGIDINDTEQALRPIIEFDYDLELNFYRSADGVPISQSRGVADSAAIFTFPKKTQFNQLPLFDVYALDNTNTTEDGDETGLVSSIFYYTESASYPVDTVLRRRISSPSSSTGDYVFQQGLVDANGRMYFFKKGGVLKSIWAPGEFTAPVWARLGSNGSFVTMPAGPAGDNQSVGTVRLATPARTGSNNVNITLSGIYELGGIMLSAGDKVLATDQIDSSENGVWVVGSSTWVPDVDYTSSTSGKVYKVEEGSLSNTFWAMIDANTFTQIDNTSAGAWMVPNQMFYNLEHENRQDIRYGDLKTHVSSILQEQTNFTGSPYGVNNSRFLPLINGGLGGKIRDYNSSFDLLVGLLNQRDVSPLSIIDFAQSSYAQALNDALEYLNTSLIDLITNGSIKPINTINASDVNVLKLVAMYETELKTKSTITGTFSDSTSAITGFPITLPYMGFPSAVPAYKFDNELGFNVIQHHDGHLSPAAVIDFSTVQRLVNAHILRSDGTSTPGSFSATVPTNPYRNQLWYSLASEKLRQFSVLSDTAVFADDIGAIAGQRAVDAYVAINPNADVSTLTPIRQNATQTAISAAYNALVDGDVWYNRSNGHVNIWNSSINNWVDMGNSSLAMQAQWKILDLTDLYNSFILAIEQQLYAGIPPFQPLMWDQYQYAVAPEREAEFFAFAAAHNEDPYKTDYDATDAFTWNYRYANFSGVIANKIGTTPGYARWFTIYENYFGTARPNLEPWILTGQTETQFRTQWPAASFGSAAMWAYVRTIWTGPLGVRTSNNTLLPPYVSASDPASADAILNVLPLNIAARYVLGDKGPVELAWVKSIEYAYGLTRVSFKKDPINFVHATWGSNLLTASEYDIDRATSSKPIQTKLVIHGEFIDKLTSRPVEKLFAVQPQITAQEDTVWTFVATTQINTGAGFVGSNNHGDIVAAARVGYAYPESGTSPISFTLSDIGIDFNIGDTITITWTADTQTTHVAFSPSNYKRFNGLNQLYAQLLRYGSLDTTTSINTSLLRDWDVRLGHRIGGILNTDTLKMNTDSYDIHAPDYKHILKTNPYVIDGWVHGLRIQAVQLGTATQTDSIFYPVGDGSDWKFRIEISNSETSELSYYTLKTGTSNQALTFKALDGKNCNVDWKHYLEKDVLATALMPLVVTGVQGVIDFIYGYTLKLEEDGWRFNSAENPQVDNKTGRSQGWQLEIEKFVDDLYSGTILGRGTLLNPFMSKIWIKTPIGVTSEFKGGKFIDLRTTPCALDVMGNIIPKDSLRVLRNDTFTQLISDVPMTAVHYILETVEHVLVFNDYSSDATSSTLIYDPFLGLRTKRIYLDGKRQSTFTGRLEFGGHVLKGKEISENIEASVTKMRNYYDTSEVASNSATSKAAQALLGYTKKSYFDNIDAPDNSQFNFWKGLIHNKGSNSSINAYLNSAKFTSASIDEYWAYKIATYGDARTKTFPEIKIESADTRNRFTVLHFMALGETPPSVSNGEILVYEDDNRWVTPNDSDIPLYFEALPSSTLTGTGQIGDIIDLPVIAQDIDGATLVNSTTAKLDASGDYKIVCYGPAAPKFSPAKLINYRNPAMLAEIPIWDPARGLHNSTAMEIVDIIGVSNPAKYNVSTQIVNNPSYDTLRPWGQEQVGTVWWDTTYRRYLSYSDATVYPTMDARLNRWGSLASWASIDVYEWVQSSVPPADWTTLVATQATNSDIPNAQKASGVPALSQVFYRDRQWSERPVAWKYSPFPPGGHNFVAGTGQQRMILTGPNPGPQIAVLNVDRFSKFGIIDGMSMSAFDHSVVQKPVGLGTFSGAPFFFIGKEDPSEWQDTFVAASTKFDSIRVQPSVAGAVGTVIGPILMSSYTTSGVAYVKATSLLTAISQSLVVDVAAAGQLVSLDFDQLGIMLYGVAQTAATAVNIQTEFGNVANDIYVREAFTFNVDIAFPADTVDPLNPGMSNDTDDLLTYGFAVWTDPTPEQLAADLPAPNNRWLAVEGDYANVSFTPSLLERVQLDASSPLIDPSGNRVNKFSFEWSAWTKLQTVIADSKVTANSNSWQMTLPATVQLDPITGQVDANSIKFHINGLVRPASEFTTNGLSVTYHGAVTVGTLITVVVKRHEPNATELAFDPDTNDIIAKSIQYKVDYEYVMKQTRDNDGTISSPIYYFWVKDKTFAALGNSISIKNAAALLTSNTDPYLVLQDYRPAELSWIHATGADAPTTYDLIGYDSEGNEIGLIQGPMLPNRFTSAAIFGLTTQVNRDSTYKLRFTQNFTLRQDPQGVDLKNVHTEWTLIRPSQNQKIPTALWDLLTNAACGLDTSGNRVPSLNRVDYDNANGTLTRFGFEPDQALVDQSLAIATIKYIILNTNLRQTVPGTDIKTPDVITALDFNEADQWFADSASTRRTLAKIWNEAKPIQINEIFFAVLNDALSNNYEFTDIFKTSMLSTYSIRVFQPDAS